MAKLNYKELRHNLIEIYESYLKNPNDKQMKTKAKEIHNKFCFAVPVLDKTTQHAIGLLIDVGWDLPNPPKPANETVNQLIKKLKSIDSD